MGAAFRPACLKSLARRLVRPVWLGLLSLSAPLGAQLVETTGLTGVTFQEVTGATTAHAFAADATQLATRLVDPLGPANADFVGLSNEYYDVFYSDASGVVDPDGDYITVECQFGGSGGLNIDEVQLNFGPDEIACGCEVTHAVYLGSGAILGSALNAADCTEGTLSSMGSATGTQRLALTVGFCLGAECYASPGNCCAGRPAFEDELYTFTGTVAVGTASPTGTTEPVLTVYDFSPPTFTAPLGVSLPIGRYSAPNWTAAQLGSIFGVTFDADGNIHATASTCYPIDYVAGGGPGAVYKIDRVTGAVTVFAALPNSGPGLGNIAYDCSHDQFFVTNHEDGRIYRLSSAGATLGAFDFGAPDDGEDGFAPLGERLWGVTVHQNRVWFGVWREDSGRASATENNEVWSVALGAQGQFDGEARRELTVSPPSPDFWTNPISDLRFTPTGSLLLAQRGMWSDSMPLPHEADALEYVCSGGVWKPSANKFLLGQIPRSCAGGLDFDYGPENRAWWSTDAMSYPDPAIYGYQGLPATGGTIATSFLLDYDGETEEIDKAFTGDIAISCPSCAEVVVGSTTCVGLGTSFSVEFTFESHQPLPVNLLTIVDLPAGVKAKPAFFNLGGLAPFTSVALSTTITGATLGQELCLAMSTHDPAQPGCKVEVCFDAPPGCLPVLDVVNLGYQGPGVAFLDPGGEPALSGTAELYLAQAPPNAPAWLIAGFLNFPFPVFGGTLVPIDAVAVVPLTTDAAGQVVVTFPVAGVSPTTVFVQAVVLDPEQAQLFGFSNALELQFH